MTETLDTTLITPLAAYLDLRTRGRAAFLLESVERGRLGRHSFVGCGDQSTPTRRRYSRPASTARSL